MGAMVVEAMILTGGIVPEDQPLTQPLEADGLSCRNCSGFQYGISKVQDHLWAPHDVTLVALQGANKHGVGRVTGGR